MQSALETLLKCLARCFGEPELTEPGFSESTTSQLSILANN